MLLNKELDNRIKDWFESMRETFRADTNRDALLGDTDNSWHDDNVFLAALGVRIVEMSQEKEPK